MPVTLAIRFDSAEERRDRGDIPDIVIAKFRGCDWR